MALKDHKQELWCASAIAGLIKHQAKEKQKATLTIASALRAVVAQREQQEADRILLDTVGVTWGSW